MMKVLCFGDSNTYGYDPCSCLGSRFPAEQRWVNLLSRKLGCAAINAGENGREIPQGDVELCLLKSMLAKESPVDLLVVMLGTNDLLRGLSADAVAARMEAFLKRLDWTKSKILMIAPPPLQRGEWVTAQAQLDASALLNKEYSALSERLGVLFADAGRWNILLAFDGVHFTEEGHSAFAQGLANFLSEGEKLCWKPV